LPLLDQHVEISAYELDQPAYKEHIIGCTGNNAIFSDPYLQNDLTIFTAGAIEGILSKEQTEISCAYRYELDMTPGVYKGERYDGRMHKIRGNHVAIVEEGRAGPDVTIRDAKGKRPLAALLKDAFGVSLRDKIRVAMDIAEREEVSKKSGVTKYGKVRFADPVNSKYPLDTPAHVASASQYFGKPKNRGKYSPKDQKVIQGRINAAKKRFKVGEYAEG
jgi:hypothetical protein